MKPTLGIALGLSLVVALESPNAQPAHTSGRAYRRSELVATALAGITPGLGHLYAGETRRGEKILLLGSLSFVALTWMLIDYGFCVYKPCGDVPRWHLYAQSTLAGVGLGAWAFGVYDARLAVRRQRRLHSGRRDRPDAELTLGLMSGVAVGPAFGIRLTW